MNRETNGPIHILFFVLKERLYFLIPLSHQRRILEMFLTLSLTLYSCIVYLAYFLRVKSGPFLIIESSVKSLYVFHVGKVNEGIANVAFVKEINWQVKKVKFILELFVKSSQHLFLGVFVRNVSYHQCGPVLGNNLLWNDLKPLVILHLMRVT